MFLDRKNVVNFNSQMNNSQESDLPSQRRRNRDGDTCFKCKEQGHWSVDCPNKTPEKFRSTPPSSPVPLFMGGLEYSPLSFLCPGCGICCALRTSRTSKNPNRKFYICPDKSCNSFRWEDEVEMEELINVPKCGCGAGFCRRLCIDTSGTNAGRKYFACPIKKGQGACTFFKLIDGELLTRNDHGDERIISPQSTMMDHGDTSPAKSVRDGNVSHKGVEIESNTVDTAIYSQNQGALSGQLKRAQLMEMELEGEKDASNEPLRKHNKRLRHDDPPYDGSSLNSVIECIDMPCKNSIHLRQVEFLRQISIEGIALAVSSTSSYSFFYPSNLLHLREDWMVTAATNLNIGLFEGWWGRLAYRPSRCLIFPAPKPFFCCIFPSYDPIFVPQSGDSYDFKPSSLRSLPGIQQVSVMKGAISGGFATLARDLQNQLLSLLESTDCDEHNSMGREARITFAALDQLQIGCQPFRERVEEFIKCASTLAEIEGSIRNDRTSYELQEIYNWKKNHFDDISHDYHEAKADLETSRERLQSLREEASHVRDMLFQVETELSCIVVENQYHETRFVQISKELMESEQAYQVAFVAAEEALKIFEQKKEEKNAAESAFKKARVELRLIM